MKKRKIGEEKKRKGEMRNKEKTSKQWRMVNMELDEGGEWEREGERERE